MSYKIGVLRFAREKSLRRVATIYRQMSKYRQRCGEEFTILTCECKELSAFIISRAALTEDALMIHFVSFKMRTPRRLVRNENPHWIMTCSRLANPIKK